MVFGFLRLCGFSSLYIGILAATSEAGITSCLNLEKFQFPLHRDPRCNNSVCYACGPTHCVSVPFTSGSSLQPSAGTLNLQDLKRFSSLYIGILAATIMDLEYQIMRLRFSSLYIGILAATETCFVVNRCLDTFQFPLHRDPRCNNNRRGTSHGTDS